MAIIDKPSNKFSAQFWTGTGNAQNITGVDFQPDLVITKAQYATSQGYFFDAIRGATKFLAAQTSDAEGTSAQSLKSFNSDGFTIGTANEVSYNGETWAAWSWKANGQGSSNTAGTINTTYTSVDVDSGCSIIKYTGNGTADATIGHGLGVVPATIFFKNLASNNWIVYHRSLGTGHYLTLNTTGASDSASGAWCTPSATLIQFNQVFGATNTSNANYMAYCFAEKQSYSKIGSYTGNDNADGTFVYLGFKPAFVMIKRTNSANDWIVLDNKRNPSNVLNTQSHLNTTASATVTTSLDFLSNGMKMRATYGGINGDNDNFIYMAFAENPFVTSTGNGSIPACAR